MELLPISLVDFFLPLQVIWKYQRRQASTAPPGVVNVKTMYFKDFDGWGLVKKRLNEETRRVHIRAGEIRWVTFGVNIGSEIDGKGVSFTRPALVVHVIGSHLALVIPMSTKIKDVAGYVPFEWRGVASALCVHQIKIVSQKRILSRKGKISKQRLRNIKTEVVKFFGL
ncbi:MAG: type II toxin-antitoxin system PemK/MazF family toxin [Candidatus Vogelbacteria bacterium]|nr:type II toxin-antitoxin system PemK/MazF family toxin [Candidatus Vogelbacteria bacterium]